MALPPGSLAVVHTNIACQSCLVLPTPRMQMSRDAVPTLSQDPPWPSPVFCPPLFLFSWRKRRWRWQCGTMTDPPPTTSSGKWVFLGCLNCQIRLCLLYFALFCLPWWFWALERPFKSFGLQLILLPLCGWLVGIGVWSGVTSHVSCVCCLSGADRLVQHRPARQRPSLAASEGAEREHRAQQSPGRSGPIGTRVRSGSRARPRLHVQFGSWAKFRAGSSTRARGRESGLA